MTANGLFSHTSTCFGTDHSPDAWQVVKCHRLRKQWALARHTGQEMSFAAYFTNEDDARAFARSMGLTVYEHTRS